MITLSAFGCEPAKLVAGEYALWRTETLNFSIRRAKETPATLRHVGWERPGGARVSKKNRCEWNCVGALQRRAPAKRIEELWPTEANEIPCGG